MQARPANSHWRRTVRKVLGLALVFAVMVAPIAIQQAPTLLAWWR